MILGAILTVFLSKLGLQFPFIIGALLFLLQLILGQIFLAEKILKKHKQSLKLGFAKTYKTIKQGISYSVGLPAIGLMVLFSSLYVMAIKGLDIFWAKRFVDISGTESVTALWVVMMIFLSLGSFAVKHWAQKGKGQIEGLLLTTILTAIFIFISTISPFFYPAAAFFVFYEFCRGTYRPLQTAYLNHHCQTGIRATVLSFNAMASSFGGMIGLLLAGFLATTFSINISWYVICLIFGLALLPLFKLSQLKFSIKR
jgi:MFS family permease